MFINEVNNNIFQKYVVMIKPEIQYIEVYNYKL